MHENLLRRAFRFAVNAVTDNTTDKHVYRVKMKDRLCGMEIMFAHDFRLRFFPMESPDETCIVFTDVERHFFSTFRSQRQNVEGNVRF